MLPCIEEHPQLYRHEDFYYLLEFIDFASSHRDLFPEMMGDNKPLHSASKVSQVRVVLPGFIKSLAQDYDLTKTDANFNGSPVLQVLFHEMCYHQPAFQKNSFGKCNLQIPVQFTHVCLLDGDNNQLLRRFMVHQTAESHRLKDGDIIKLENYTQMTHHVKDKPPKPSVFIMKYSVVGYNRTPNCTMVSDPLPCTTTPVSQDNKKGKGPKGMEIPPCQMRKCLC